MLFDQEQKGLILYMPGTTEKVSGDPTIQWPFMQLACRSTANTQSLLVHTRVNIYILYYIIYIYIIVNGTLQ